MGRSSTFPCRTPASRRSSQAGRCDRSKKPGVGTAGTQRVWAEQGHCLVLAAIQSFHFLQTDLVSHFLGLHHKILGHRPITTKTAAAANTGCSSSGRVSPKKLSVFVIPTSISGSTLYLASCPHCYSCKSPFFPSSFCSWFVIIPQPPFSVGAAYLHRDDYSRLWAGTPAYTSPCTAQHTHGQNLQSFCYCL